MKNILFSNLFSNYFYNFLFFIFDRELAHLTHDLNDLSSSLHIEAHIINELS